MPRSRLVSYRPSFDSASAPVASLITPTASGSPARRDSASSAWASLVLTAMTPASSFASFPWPFRRSPPDHTPQSPGTRGDAFHEQFFQWTVGGKLRGHLRPDGLERGGVFVGQRDLRGEQAVPQCVPGRRRPSGSRPWARRPLGVSSVGFDLCQCGHAYPSSLFVLCPCSGALIPSRPGALPSPSAGGAPERGASTSWRSAVLFSSVIAHE